MTSFIPDPDAIGFVFGYDVNSKRDFKASYLSNSKDPALVITKDWMIPSSGKVAIPRPGVVEITLDINKLSEDEGGSLLLLLVAYLGHVVFI